MASIFISKPDVQLTAVSGSVVAAEIYASGFLSLGRGQPGYTYTVFVSYVLAFGFGN